MRHAPFLGIAPRPSPGGPGGERKARRLLAAWQREKFTTAAAADQGRMPDQARRAMSDCFTKLWHFDASQLPPAQGIRPPSPPTPSPRPAAMWPQIACGEGVGVLEGLGAKGPQSLLNTSPPPADRRILQSWVMQ